jgi:hypothetical protein
LDKHIADLDYQLDDDGVTLAEGVDDEKYLLYHDKKYVWQAYRIALRTHLRLFHQAEIDAKLPGRSLLREWRTDKRPPAPVEEEVVVEEPAASTQVVNGDSGGVAEDVAPTPANFVRKTAVHDEEMDEDAVLYDAQTPSDTGDINDEDMPVTDSLKPVAEVVTAEPAAMEYVQPCISTSPMKSDSDCRASPLRDGVQDKTTPRSPLVPVVTLYEGCTLVNVN